MSGIIKATMITSMVILILIAGFTATAAKPAFTGVKMPPAVDGKTGAVTGRVTAAANATTGMTGAYIAVVNASNASEEYANTTADASGYYQILGLNATYNATNPADIGPNGATPYRIYASNGIYGEGYSAAFGIDSSGPGTGSGGIPPVTVTSSVTPVPSSAATPTPLPTATPAPSVMPTTGTGTATAAPPTATPQPSPYVIPPTLALLAAGCFAAWMILKRDKN